jgi:hypothetical protein
MMQCSYGVSSTDSKLKGGTPTYAFYRQTGLINLRTVMERESMFQNGPTASLLSKPYGSSVV